MKLAVGKETQDREAYREEAEGGSSREFERIALWLLVPPGMTKSAHWPDMDTDRSERLWRRA